MVYTRDPLSVRFDPQARTVISLAIEQAEKRRANPRLTSGIRLRVPNPPIPEPRESHGDRLSVTERAFCRSLYYDRRIHNMKGNRPDARWSLKLEWEAVPLLPGQQRYVRVTVFPDSSGARHVERNQSTSYAVNPELRNTGGR